MIPAPVHRRTFRKRLDDDCLLDRQLHPSIAERLDRIRQLPVSNVANFHGVEVDADGVWLVWQYIEGVTLEQYLLQEHSQTNRAALARELRLLVQAVHAHGIVHGGIHARNVIIDPQGMVHLTHVSPLLYSDPAQDDRALDELFQRCGIANPAVADVTAFLDRADQRLRWGVYLLAALTVLAGILIFVSILWYIRA
jgi:serine/threonine protein kinase